MPSGTINPSGDGATTDWEPSAGGNNAALVDDGIQPPTNPPTDTFVSSDIEGIVDEYQMTTLVVGSVSQVIVWVNLIDMEGGSNEVDVSIFVNGGWEADIAVTAPAAQGWDSATFNGAWTQANLDALQVRLTCKSAGPVIKVYEVTGVVTYGEAAAFIPYDFSGDLHGGMSRVSGGLS